MKTFVSITRQMLNGEISMEEAAEEMMQLTPAKPHYDIDGVSYEGDQDNTTSAMKLLSVDKNTGKVNPQINDRIYALIDTILEKEKSE